MVGLAEVGRRATRKCLDLRGSNMVSHITVLMAELSPRLSPFGIQGGLFLGVRTPGILSGLPTITIKGGCLHYYNAFALL